MKKATLILFLASWGCFLNAQNPKIIEGVHSILGGCDYYEVTGEMFEMIAEDPRFQQATEIQQMSFLIFVECRKDQQDFYETFHEKVDTKEFKVLMRRRSQNEQITFYRRKNGEEKEYLLVHDNGLSYLVTSLNIATLQDLQSYIQLAGSFGLGR